MDVIIKAPKGYDGRRCFRDGDRDWHAYARPVGCTWWTDCGGVGHAGMSSGALDRLAMARITVWVKMGMVR